MKALRALLVAMLIGGGAAVLLDSAVRAEDFSVHINDLATVDAARPMPVYELKRIPRQADAKPSSDMPEKWFDVFIAFKDFGNVRLDEVCEAGPDRAGHAYRSGLADLKGVRVAWIKGSPDIAIVAWVSEPDNRGNDLTFCHGYVILQLKESRAQVLLRGGGCLGARVNRMAQERSYFSFNPTDGFLQERMERYYEKSAPQPHGLARPCRDDDGNTVFTAVIRETVTVSYKLSDGELVPASCNLVYKTQARDELSEIAHFYLGPLAPRRVLLEANAALAAKYKDTVPGAGIYLDAGLEVNVPVPDKWLIDSFAHGLSAKEEKH